MKGVNSSTKILREFPFKNKNAGLLFFEKKLRECSESILDTLSQKFYKNALACSG